MTPLRPLNLEWRLDDASRRRIILASALPTIVIVAQLVVAIALYLFEEDSLLGTGLWHRVYFASVGLLTLTPAAVAALFFVGLRRWSRVEGSWMLLIGALLATVAIVFGFMATLVFVVITDKGLISDLRVDVVWLAISRTFG